MRPGEDCGTADAGAYPPTCAYESLASCSLNPTDHSSRGPRKSHSKIDEMSSSILLCTEVSSVTPQLTATWQARLGAIPWAISCPA